jgi:phage gpG-like protein
MKWDGGNFLNRTRAEIQKGFVRAGVYYVSQTRGYLNTDQPYKRAKSSGRHRGLAPSKPGEYPRKLSGQLQRSITWAFDPAKLVLTVGSNLAGYPAILQLGSRFMAPRPWLSLSFEAEQDTLARLILGQ